jgi:hypothetical protein
MLTDKDKDAIAHIASVSKHPHAPVIVEWLLTGYQVEYFEDNGPWNLCYEYPVWYKENKYLIVYPKIKPAYRVYRYKGESVTCTQDRFTDGTESPLDFPHDTEFLSDWIEYDEPKNWPTPLVERIAAIDLEAAQWIVDHWDELLDDRYTKDSPDGIVVYSRESNELNKMFSWGASGRIGYWINIYKQLNK